VSDVASREWNEENGRSHRAFLDEVGAAVLPGCELVPSTQAVSIRRDDPAGTTSTGPFI